MLHSEENLHGGEKSGGGKPSPFCQEETSFNKGLGRRPVSLHAVADEGRPRGGYDPSGPRARHRGGDVDPAGPVGGDVVLVVNVLVGAVHDQAGAFGCIAKLRMKWTSYQAWTSNLLALNHLMTIR